MKKPNEIEIIDLDDYEVEPYTLDDFDDLVPSETTRYCDRCETTVHDGTSCSDIECELFNPRGGEE